MYVRTHTHAHIYDLIVHQIFKPLYHSQYISNERQALSLQSYSVYWPQSLVFRQVTRSTCLLPVFSGQFLIPLFYDLFGLPFVLFPNGTVWNIFVGYLFLAIFIRCPISSFSFLCDQLQSFCHPLTIIQVYPTLGLCCD